MKKSCLIFSCIVLAHGTIAQTFSTLHVFSATYTNAFGVHTNSDGANPYSRLILVGDELYGTAYYGGEFGNGAVFKLKVDGSDFAVLHNFAATSSSAATNYDGALPRGLVPSANTLFGTTQRGGVPSHGGNVGRGTVFAVNTDGTGFTNLHSFAGASHSDGAFPGNGLCRSDDILYGIAEGGGLANQGVLFKVKADGSGFSNFYSFTGASGSSATNVDGRRPLGDLIISDDTLYGTALEGGYFGGGAVFRIKSDGTGFSNLYSFTAASPYPGPYTNSDGALPYAGLLLLGNSLYGTTSSGGGAGNGTVFKVNIDGSGLTTIHSFATGTGSLPPGPGVTNVDGAAPVGGLIRVGETLYGTTQNGGGAAAGTIFAINMDGSGFTNLHHFTGLDGANPSDRLVLSGDFLYGTTAGGGRPGKGTVFRIALPIASAPRLVIIPSNTNSVLTWPSNVSFNLQSAPTASGVFTNVPSATSPYTNPISGAQQFFRLISN